MSGEIEVPETPNWLKSLEEKREKRVKARLGHEAGAGAPCLKCGDKCPGLDLHFWRKACKICRCQKEEHDVHDDDIYGWAQFQLLGSKPNKIKTKIVLPGKKDEVELEWAPKGHKDTIDKYLKTLPPESLPVKGSLAAQERKQMLQKQIPIHDIDPLLCHELNEEEVKKMEEYIAHVKKSSVGVGQIVNLSSIIKANLHNISPQEAHIIASRYSKGIPFSEIVKLQSGLAKKLERITINEPHNKSASVPSMYPNNSGIVEQSIQNPLVANKYKDITHPSYIEGNLNKEYSQAQHTQKLKHNLPNVFQKYPDYQPANYSIDDKLLQGTNFDPTRTPSQFIGYKPSGYRHPHSEFKDNILDKLTSKPLESNSPINPEMVTSQANEFGPLKGQQECLPFNKVSGNVETGVVENPIESHGLNPAYAQNLPGHKNLELAGQCGFENPYFNQKVFEKNPKRGTCDPASKNTFGKVQSFTPNKYDIQNEIQNPKVPKSVKDLMYSTYDPTKGPLPKDLDNQVLKNRLDTLTASFHDPNVTLNTFKHDPSAIKYEPTAISEMHEPAQPIKGDYSMSGTPAKGYIDPITGEFVRGNVLDNQSKNFSGPRNPGQDLMSTEQISKGDQIINSLRYDLKAGNYVSELPNYDSNNPGNTHLGPGHTNNGSKSCQNPYGVGIHDSETGNKMGRNYPEDVNCNPNSFRDLNKELGYLDPKTGKIIFDGQSLYQSKYFDPDTGNYNSGNGHRPEGNNYDNRKTIRDQENSKYDPNNQPEDTRNFNPEIRKFIPETENNRPHPPEALENFQSPAKTNLITDKYLSDKGNDPSNLNIRRPQNIPGIEYFDPNNPNAAYPESKTGYHKNRKGLYQLQPGQIDVPEDYLEPHLVNVGCIQDINPNIRVATAETNPGFDNESIYDDDGEYSPDSIREILNNIKLPDCHYCKKPFEENEYAVTVDRANVLFHASCFRCAGCNQNLADNIYFYHKETDNVYCGRDYAKIKGYPRCSACDELIFTKEYCLAENSTFHLKHFCCFQCDSPLAGQDYTLEDEKPYCLPCYETSKAAKCSTCEKIIKPDEVGCQLNGVHFHAEDRCFRCIVCSMPLMGKKLLLRNEKLFCSHDCFNRVKK